jgi:ABC-type polysaccharide/polyol phosphate export permease
MLFLIIAFCIQILRQTIVKYRKMFQHEKYWKTLQALLVAPINHFNILIGLLIAEIILISIPITIFLIIAIIIYPISFFNMLLVILMILVISLTFGSIGLIIGILIISKEGFYKIIDIGFTFLFWLSCISYPIQIFPELVRIVILLNPLYYLFDLLRLIWLVGIDPVLAINYLSPAHIIIASVMLISLPIIAVYLFNVFYKKFGITGY